ncbi:MAG: hypothetical protein H6Q73_4275 [Firmicutes bacterium]|nr:hypothetical protein [Bacillota bacterium]
MIHNFRKRIDFTALKLAFKTTIPVLFGYLATSMPALANTLPSTFLPTTLACWKWRQ